MDIDSFANLKDFNKNNAKTLLDLSFNVSNWSQNNSDDSVLPKINNFILIKTLNTHDTYGLKNRKFCVLYYSQSMNTVIITFSGTVFISEWLDDFDIRQTKPIFIPENYNILLHLQHYNFYNYLRNELIDCLKKYINEDTIVVCTGHSLGGSVANICFTDLIINDIVKNRTLYTFASSRTGNTAFANIINNEETAFRIANSADLVPTLPPPIVEKYIYTHSNGIYFTKNLETLDKNHGESYTEYFNDK